ncbi:MAG: DUF4124 domain-containing protein [Gammaproteobacteria bacterium]|nr:DUF4124 domain-containing protein [Gammaproteobacteria bacterium]
MRHYLIATLAVLLTAPVCAEIFKSVDEFGNVVFSDLPPTKTSEPVTVTPINSYEAPAQAAPAAAPPSAVAAMDANYYQYFAVTDPAPDTAIRDNAGNVTISVGLSPALRGDHRLLLVLDGQATEVEAQDNQFILSNIDRGTHTAAARIVNRDGAEISRSTETSFHMLRAIAPRPAQLPSGG